MSGGASAFAATADPAVYVPHAGAERVLASLEEWACDPERPLHLLRGPEGAGKSMLLAVLASRVGRHAIPVSVSASGLDPETLARTLLAALGVSWEGTPRVALARAVEQPGARRLLLLVDDADALAPRTEMWLFDFVRRAGGVVQALLAVRDERLAAELASAYQTGTAVSALETPMSREESDAWVRAALARADADGELRARFDAPVLARLHARAGGVPGRLRQEAAAIAASGTAAQAALAAPPALVPAAPAVPAASAASAPRASAEALPATTAIAAERFAAAASAAAAAPRAQAPRREPAALEAPPHARSREPREPAPRPAVPSPLRDDAVPAPPRDAAGSRPAARPAAPVPSDATRSGVDPAPLRDVPRRDGVLRWLLVPAALAVAFVGGFLASQTLEALRPAPTPDNVAVAPSVTAAPPAAERRADPFTPPALPPPVAGPVVAPAPAAAVVAPEPAAPAVELPAVSAAPPAAVEPPPAGEATGPPLADAAPTGAALAETSAPETPGAEPPATAEAEAATTTETAAAPPARARRRAAARRVAVTVEAEPGASILVNGEPVGSGTVSGLELAPGPHRVEVRLPDGRVVERVVDVKGTRFDVKVR